MKRGWFVRKKHDGTQHVHRPAASEDGWVLGNVDQPDHSELGAYAGQLVEEGFAEKTEDRYLLPWDSLYRLLDEEAHAASLVLLGLPPQSELIPHLASEGSPADTDFRIRLAHWVSPQGALPPSSVSRTGAVVRWHDRDALLSPAAYRLLGAMHELANEGDRWTPEQRLLAAGRIQSLAHACRASTDGYLSQTEVVVPERLDVELIAEQACGVPVVELVPRPDGAPDTWPRYFDDYDHVRARYDIVRPDGELTHVALPPPVRGVLEQIKKVPGRRYASQAADAFLHNPYPFLGEGAETVLPPERFEQAKKASGIVERELLALPSDPGWDLLLLDTTGEHSDVCKTIARPEELKDLLAAAAEARTTGLPLFRWGPHRVLFSGTTHEALQQLGTWVASAAATPAALDMAEVFDLRAYSDRVVGFDGKPIHVPFLGRKDASGDLVPDNLQLVIASTDPITGHTSTTRLAANQLAEFDRATRQALDDGAATVRLPGATLEVPTTEARECLDAFDKAWKKPPAAPTVPKPPQPGRATSLSILHNIEALEYGAAVAALDSEPIAPVLPAALRPEIELKGHQQSGLAWLQHRFAQRPSGLRGALLADDMGLGKTLQCLCLMAWYRENHPHPHPCLVIAPVSLLQNWHAEIGKFLDGSQGPTLLLYGQALAGHRVEPSQLGEDVQAMGVKKLLRPGFANGAAFVLTTYETLRDYELSFGREAWGVLVCDEAQKIKTPGALVTRSAKAMQADFKIACTGTPVENSLADLWCLFDFFQPGRLGSLSEFTKNYRKPIELREDDHATRVEDLRTAIGPWVLRRMKSEVADLPDKIDATHKDSNSVWASLPMSEMQRRLYGEAVVGYKRAMEKAKDDGEQAGTMTLALLHRLRMICANPLAMAHEGAGESPVSEHVAHSPKLQWLLQRLGEVKQLGEKAIVFTEYRDIQRLVQKAVAERFDIDVSVVNGSTTVDPLKDASRQRLIDRFQDSPGFGVIVLSTTAVGFGVNIQKANHVIHFTRPWNPAKEDQATDRAYRIGQDKPVWVYCPTMAGDGFESFEQRLAERLDRKRALSQDLLAPEQSVGMADFEDLIS
ncbi:DEAD/DEAH box helicase [Frateuria hangzhouensis]|uniref:DEAD/DEAH box helicase n=1 Tax=Frateuria hangzhouensis TaxID=2995589 RepID=UPI002260E6E5|nr:DEAD/DEAH box helicase [Frateuria sp. STR12]MCX7512580.1 DEAD/DEAH box helicase [Frateuria sp. STR12]